MTDTKLSALAFGTTPDFTYGIESSASKRYAAQKIYNVKTYGAVGNGTADDTTSVQNAVNAALATGGTVYFPPGTYKVTKAAQKGAIVINSAVSAPNTQLATIRIVGDGNLSAIVCSSAVVQYAFELQTASVQCFEDLLIVNNNTLAAITASNTCAGCVLDSGGGFGTPAFTNCQFQINGGIGIYSVSQQINVTNCEVSGGYDGTNASQSIGYFLAGGGRISDTKIFGLGYGIIICQGGGSSAVIFNLDIEVCGTAISMGYSPIPFMSAGAPPDPPVLQSAGFYGCAGHVTTVGTESCGSTDASDTYGTMVFYGGLLHIENVEISQFGQKGPANYGMYFRMTNGMVSNVLLRVGLGTVFTLAGIGLDSPGGLFFKNVNVDMSNNPSGTPFLCKYVNAFWLDGGSRYILPGASIEACNFDAALPIASFPPYPAPNLISTASNMTAYCSDSTLPTVGNVGTPLTGSATTTATSTNPSTTLTFAPTTGIPAQVVSGWHVTNVSNIFSINSGTTVSGAPNYAAGTLTLSSAVVTGHPVAIGDIFAFLAPGTGTNKVLMRWDGKAWRISA